MNNKQQIIENLVKLRSQMMKLQPKRDEKSVKLLKRMREVEDQLWIDFHKIAKENNHEKAS